MNDTFCPLPFIQFDSKSSAPCCFMKKSDDYYQSIPNSFNEMLEHNEVKKLQNDLLSGIKTKACKECWHYESIGETSMRQNANKAYPTPEHFTLYSLILDTGNICNLSCRTCGSGASSGWIKEEKAYDSFYHTKTQAVNSIKYTDIDNMLTHDFSKLENIEIIGGEPFKDLKHLKVLETIVEQGASRNCNLSYTTNATQSISQSIKDILNQFKNVNLTLSIDSIGKPFTYIRTDGNWNDVLNFIKNAKEEGYSLSGHPCISVLNIFYIDELYRWFAANNLPWSIVIATTPKHYGFSILNEQRKQKLIDKLEKSNFDHSNLINHIQLTAFEQSSLDSFWQYIEFTEKYKGYAAIDYIPKLISFLNE